MPAVITASNLADRAESFSSLLEASFYDAGGLPYAYLNRETLVPFIHAEVADYPLHFSGMPDPAEWLSHENTPMVAGHYLSALCELPRTVDIAARISRIFSGIRHLVAISEDAWEAGWLSKPYGGRPSMESSCDQYGAVIAGLRKLALADRKESEDATALIVRLVEFWMRHDYRCPFHGNANHRWMGRHQWGFVVMAFVRVAYELTSEEKFARESERLCCEEGCDYPSPRSGSFLRNISEQHPHRGLRKLSAFHHLVVEYLEILLAAWPERREHWLTLLGDFWQCDVRPGWRADGLLHATYWVDLRDNAWSVPQPHYVGTPGAALHQDWIGGCLSGSMSCFAAASAVRVGNALPIFRPECQALAESALHTVDETLMTLVTDPDGNQEHPAFRGVRTRMLDGRAPAQWLQAYGQGGALGWWN